MTFAAHANPVMFKNKLSACVTIKTLKTSTASNIILAHTSVQLHKPIGECGCLSTLATYRSSVDNGGARQILQEGLIAMDSGGEKTLVLATDRALVAKKSVQVQLACAGPL
jgi:hypothetical protein